MSILSKIFFVILTLILTVVVGSFLGTAIGAIILISLTLVFSIFDVMISIKKDLRELKDYMINGTKNNKIKDDKITHIGWDY